MPTLAARHKRRLQWVGASLLGILVGYLGVLVYGYLLALPRAQRAEAQAVAAQQASAQRASNRITQLQTKIDNLETQADSNHDLIGELVAEESALEFQVRQLGGRPVVTSQTSAAKPSSTTTTTKPSSTTSTTRPSTGTTTTTLPCTLTAGDIRVCF
jgi:TolA-binding protein